MQCARHWQAKSMAICNCVLHKSPSCCAPLLMGLPYPNGHSPMQNLTSLHLMTSLTSSRPTIPDLLWDCSLALFLQPVCVLGVTLCMVNFDVRQTLFHIRWWGAAHTRGIVVIAVTTSRPVAASSLCKSKGCDELMRTCRCQ